MTRHPSRTLVIELPEWVRRSIEEAGALTDDESKMRLVNALARENVVRGEGGPFAAAVFERATHGLLAAGVNSVERLNNSVLHAEVMALMFAQSRTGSYTLHTVATAGHELISSCEPCAMCLGAVLWSGVRRLVCGARREDATEIGFEEGPVSPQSYRYLQAHGIEVVRGVLAEEARDTLELYRRRNGLLYNG